MKRLAVLVVLIAIVGLSAAPGLADGLEDSEFRVGLYPSYHLGSSGASFSVWTVGWTHPLGPPLLMVDFGLTFANRMAVTVTSTMQGDEPLAFRGWFFSVYASLGLEQVSSTVGTDWFGEIGLMVTIGNGLHLTIGYGSSAWLNVGVGLTATVHDIFGFIRSNADRPLL